ncbi:MAG: hypothetical protein Q4F65_03600 [Propionibacteriaceae bacterium]|nr:hypothetical protein [Propionibacteriaceae bacterium]
MRRPAALAVVAAVALTGCAGPTRTPASPAPMASGPASALPVGITPSMTTWDSTVELPGVGEARFTREGDDAVVTLTAGVAGVRVGLARGARITDDVAFACGAQVLSGAAADGALGAGRTAVVRYEDCAHGDTFAWNYMVDAERTLSFGVQDA